jgi:hypothetical protein
MATIYEVVESDNQIRFYYFATKREAMKHQKDYDAPFDGAACEVNPMQVKLTKAGVVAELNHLMTKTCFNEG